MIIFAVNINFFFEPHNKDNSEFIYVEYIFFTFQEFGHILHKNVLPSHLNLSSYDVLRKLSKIKRSCDFLYVRKICAFTKQCGLNDEAPAPIRIDDVFCIVRTLLILKVAKNILYTCTFVQDDSCYTEPGQGSKII